MFTIATVFSLVISPDLTNNDKGKSLYMACTSDEWSSKNITGVPKLSVEFHWSYSQSTSRVIGIIEI